MPILPYAGISSVFSSGWRHAAKSAMNNDEGPDDLPAHFKASLLGCQLTLPIQSGGLALGTWQGIYLGEHRDRGGARRVLATWQGESV